MKLYDYWRSSSAYRVRIALAYKGLAYESVPVHLVRDGGQQHSAQYRVVNAMGQVPVLEVQEGNKRLQISQSIAIIEYLEESFPTPALFPQAREQRAQVRELTELINSGIQPFQNTSTVKYLAEFAPQCDTKLWLKHFIAGGLDALEAKAGQSAGRYLVGDTFSMADCCLIPQLYASRRFQVSLEGCPTLLRVEAACNELAAVRTAHPENQADAERP